MQYRSKINGFIQITIGLFWLLHYVRLWYLYNYTDVLFNFMYPNWILVLFSFLSISGIIVGVFTIFNKLKWNGYILIIGLFLIGCLVNEIVV